MITNSSSICFFLILAIIVIIIMAYFIYKFYNEKTTATEQVANLNNQVSSLGNTVDRLQGKIDSISNTINTNSSDNTRNNNLNSNKDRIALKMGEYSINEMNVTPDPESYGIASVRIKENNEFVVDMPLGTSYIGMYSIEGNNLVCKATKQSESEGGGIVSNNV